ncbi:MAG: endonuclease/exonuclease/phosphatase family protein [Acidobacteriota bacterium]
MAPEASAVVMSYNIRGSSALRRSAHLVEIADVIQKSTADIVGLQEVHRSGTARGHQDQAADLARLTGMTPLFGQSFEHGRGDFGNLLLTRQPASLTAIHRLPGRGEPRTLLEARVDLSGSTLRVFVVHLAAWWPLGRANRLAQTAAVAGFVSSAEGPFVLLGDFNTTPGSRELRQFHSGRLVTSCFPDRSATHRTSRRCLDYIFVHPGMAVESASVLRTGPSDHWPLLAKLRWDHAPIAEISAR